MPVHRIRSIVFLKQLKETNKKASNFGVRNVDDPCLVSSWSKCAVQRWRQRQQQWCSDKREPCWGQSEFTEKENHWQMASVACCTSLFLSTIVQGIIPGHSVVCLAVLQWNTKLHVRPGQREGGGAWMWSPKQTKKTHTLYKSKCNKIL